MVGWQIPVYDRGEFVGNIHLVLNDDWREGYKASARFVEEKQIPIVRV